MHLDLSYQISFALKSSCRMIPICTCVSSSATLFLSSSSSPCSRALRSDERLLSSRSCSRAWAASLLFSSYLPLRSSSSVWIRLTRVRSASSSRWAACPDWPVWWEERVNDDTAYDHLSESFIAVYLLNWLLCAVVGVLDLLHLTASLTLWSWPKRPERRPPAAGHKQASYGSSPEPVLKDRERNNNTWVRKKQQEVLNSWAVNSRRATAPEPPQTHQTKPVRRHKNIQINSIAKKQNASHKWYQGKLLHLIFSNFQLFWSMNLRYLVSQILNC